MGVTPAWTREAVRDVDRRAIEDRAIPSLVLMENAGRGAAEWLLPRVRPGGRVLVLCGSGNNGGDGGVVARHLAGTGLAVRVVWFGDPARRSPDAAAQHRILGLSGIDQVDGLDPDTLAAELAAAEWIVDALLGTGLTREVEGPMRAVIEAVNASGRPVLALDLPSGLDADTGRPLGVAVRATATATFVGRKVGFDAPGASAYTGAVFSCGIGLPGDP
jgi:NAD(P)H-hydrate epimerase